MALKVEEKSIANYGGDMDNLLYMARI